MAWAKDADISSVGSVGGCAGLGGFSLLLFSVAAVVASVPPSSAAVVASVPSPELVAGGFVVGFVWEIVVDGGVLESAAAAVVCDDADVVGGEASVAPLGVTFSSVASVLAFSDTGAAAWVVMPPVSLESLR